MNKNIKHATKLCTGLILLFIFLFWPIFPWSARCRYNLDRLVVKAQVGLAKLKGQIPQVISISGKLVRNKIAPEVMSGVDIVTLESASGYAAMSNNEGRFVLPHLMWYPGATYNIIITADIHHVKLFKIHVSANYIENNILDIGELCWDEGYEASKTAPLIRHLYYDNKNNEYYRNIFNKLTSTAISDHEKINAINKYVATKLNHNELAYSFESPRQILEKGSGYCSNLALAMATIVGAGNYPVRTVHLSDTPQYLNTHVVVEVYYEDKWHLYDPTYSVFFVNKDNVVASYKEIRLNTNLITHEAFQNFNLHKKDCKKHCAADLAISIFNWMPNVFSSGFYKIYQMKKDGFCSVEQRLFG